MCFLAAKSVNQITAFPSLTTSNWSDYEVVNVKYSSRPPAVRSGKGAALSAYKAAAGAPKGPRWEQGHHLPPFSCWGLKIAHLDGCCRCPGADEMWNAPGCLCSAFIPLCKLIERAQIGLVTGVLEWVGLVRTGLTVVSCNCWIMVVLVSEYSRNCGYLQAFVKGERERQGSSCCRNPHA